MISLPTETHEDVVAIGELATRCAQIARRNGVKNPTITIGVSAFVPKPFTPFQWHGQDMVAEIDAKQQLLKRSLRDRAVTYRPNEPNSTQLEAILSLGDRRLSDAIELVWRRGQFFDLVKVLLERVGIHPEQTPGRDEVKALVTFPRCGERRGDGARKRRDRVVDLRAALGGVHPAGEDA